MGPLLHFNGQEHRTWNVSALYVLPETLRDPPDLIFFYNNKKQVAFGTILGTKFGYQFVRYMMGIKQGTSGQMVEYYLPNENPHFFHVPAIEQPSNILYHSCNGYQTEADRKQVGGITPIWAAINSRHGEKPFDIQLGGGDQIYADGLIYGSSCNVEPSVGNMHGVFALTTLQEWLNDKESLNTALFTPAMRAEVQQFYFNQYVNHFNEDQFKEAMASIPAINQPDDHDFYDGCGSYPEALQNSPVMSGIRNIASWFAFVVQHQISKTEFPRPRLLGQNRGYHFLHVIDNKRLAILGVDTRTERTAGQIVAAESWRNIFDLLEGLLPDVQHLLVMLGVPVVYASTTCFESTLSAIDSTASGHTLLSFLPGMLNQFGLPELADDFRDAWSHKDHVAERNHLIKNLQRLANQKHIRVTLLGGDVHLGGAGKIYRRDCGIDDVSDHAMIQIISSPVGNAPVSKLCAMAIGMKACSEQQLEDGCAMCVFKLCREGCEKEAPSLIYKRNFVMLNLDPNDLALKVRWSAEPLRGGDHKIYYLNIPPSFYSIQ